MGKEVPVLSRSCQKGGRKRVYNASRKRKGHDI